MDKLIPFAINDITLPSHHLSTNNRKHIVYLTYKMMIVNCMSPLLKEANTHGIVLYLVEEDEILMSPLNQAFGRFQIDSEAANLQISKIELRGRLQKLSVILNKLLSVILLYRLVLLFPIIWFLEMSRVLYYP
jgi:hypothetical protein